MKPVSAAQERPEAYTWRWSFLAPKYWLMWLWFALLWLITRLPVSVVQAVGAFVGRLFYRFANSRRRVALRNLALCFPEKTDAERDAICRKSFEGMGMTLFESGIVWWSSFARMQRLTRIENAEGLQKALASGQGVMMVGMHNTCLEMSYAAIAFQHPFSAIYRIHDNPLWECISGWGRLRYNIGLIGRKNVRAFIAALQAGELTLMAPDQDLGKRRAVFAPFFGVSTAWVTSACDFPEQAGAKVIFVSVRREFGSAAPYRITFSEPLDNFPSGDKQADMSRISRMTEEAIRLDPSQYLWAHRRFKSRPEGEADLY
ncbi:MAG TPA: LpxL/LpxP family Kdo(2)-lipid IV(A) lauroyl/palmitoleoyl acyltransferase [Pseudomonadales bacterium]|nr:LpxL/LpxP family Kdo(2)-lipid IV(A) lauroyl/palmitoleoyl acyltransferase [Pseudomonadales bacterium]